MSLIDEAPDAVRWVERESSSHGPSNVFGRIASGVIWSDDAGPDGHPIGGDDPAEIAIQFSDTEILRDHDPGLPAGRILATQCFVTPSGRRFVAAIMGLYASDLLVSFSAVGVNPQPIPKSPDTLGDPSADWHLQLQADPREVGEAWLKEVAKGCPLPVVRDELSHNSQEALVALLQIGLPYAPLVWNPYVTTVASKSGEAVYAGIHSWLCNLWPKLKGRDNSVVSIASGLNGCDVRFIFRGSQFDRLASAHAKLHIAASQAAKLINDLRANGHYPLEITYECSGPELGWYASYVRLADGRLVSETLRLQPVEALGRGLSLGFTVTNSDGTAVMPETDAPLGDSSGSPTNPVSSVNSVGGDIATKSQADSLAKDLFSSMPVRRASARQKVRNLVEASAELHPDIGEALLRVAAGDGQSAEERAECIRLMRPLGLQRLARSQLVPMLFSSTCPTALASAVSDLCDGDLEGFDLLVDLLLSVPFWTGDIDAFEKRAEWALVCLRNHLVPRLTVGVDDQRGGLLFDVVTRFARFSSLRALITDIHQAIRGVAFPFPVVQATEPGAAAIAPVRDAAAPGSSGGSRKRKERPRASRRILPSDERGIDVSVILPMLEEFKLFREFFPGMDGEYNQDDGRYYYSCEWPAGGGETSYRLVSTFVNDKGDKGEVPATIVAERLIQRFRPAGVVLLGIAGSLHDDVRLGDVVVPNIVDSYMQDVKAVPSADEQRFEFRPSGSPFRADPHLVAHVSNLESAHPAAYEQWLRACMADLPRQVASDEDRGWLRTARVVGDKPSLIVDRLASGPVVVAAEAFRTWLRTNRDRNYKAVDEESGGMMRSASERPVAVPSLVIRGVSDAGDRNKARVEQIGDGALRRYAMRNGVRLLLALLDLGLMPRVSLDRGRSGVTGRP